MLTSSSLVATTTTAGRSDARSWRLACRVMGSPPWWVGLSISAALGGSMISHAWWGGVMGVAAAGMVLTFALVYIASIEYD